MTKIIPSLFWQKVADDIDAAIKRDVANTYEVWKQYVAFGSVVVKRDNEGVLHAVSPIDYFYDTGTKEKL